MIKHFTSLLSVIIIVFFCLLQNTQAQSIKFLANLPGFIHSDVKANDNGAVWYFRTQIQTTLVTTKIIVSTDEEGNVLWTKAFNEDFSYEDMAVQNDGSIIIGGYKNKGAGSLDAALLKVDENGTEIWSRTISAQIRNYVTSIQSNENIIYAAITSNSFVSNTLFYHSTIIAFSQDGTELWKRNFSHPTSATDYIFSRTALATNGDLLALADIRGSANAQANGLMLTRITPEGNVVFSKYFNFVADYNQLSSSGIVETSDGEIIIGGRLMTDQISTFPNNMFLAKVSASGDVLLQKEISGGLNVGEQLHSLRKFTPSGENTDMIFAMMAIATNNQDVPRSYIFVKINLEDLSIKNSKVIDLSIIYEDPYGQNRNSFDIANDGSLYMAGGFRCEIQSSNLGLAIKMNSDFTTICDSLESEIAFTDSLVDYPVTDYTPSSGLTYTVSEESVGITDYQNAVFKDLCEGCSETVSLDYIKQNNISIYPNPAESILNINRQENQTLGYVIYDISGRKVQSEKTLNHTVIDISNLFPGIYTIQLIDNKGLTPIKFIKK